MRKVGNWDCTKKNFGSSDQTRVSKSNDLSNLGTSTWHPLKSLQLWNAKSNSLGWCVVWTVLRNMSWISKSSQLNFSGGPKYGSSTPRNLPVYWKGSYDHTQECMCSLGSSTLYRGHFYILGSSTPMQNIMIFNVLHMSKRVQHILPVCKAQSDNQALWIAALWRECYPTFLSIGRKSFSLQAQLFYLVENPSICEHKFLPDHPSWNFGHPRDSGYSEPLVCSMYIHVYYPK